ncbi:MAG: hypothetical protein Q9N68_13470 [Gammaproteobacteria bacterium]|nr:hypothetical protein [Gammaproteobacteria bacterium]
MKNTVQTLVFPLRSIYQQHGLKTALPAALMWLGGLTTLIYSMSHSNGIIINLGLALWISTQILTLLASDSPQHHRNIASPPTKLEQNYDEDPLAAVNAALHSEKNQNHHINTVNSKRNQRLNKPLPSCTVAL